MALDYLSDNFKRQFPKHIDADYEQADMAALYAIPTYTRYSGMMCWVLSDADGNKALYILDALPTDDLSDNTYWKKLDTGEEATTVTQQIAYVDDATGNDGTAVMNDPNLPYKTIKKAIDDLRGVISIVRIAAGDYICPEEILANIDPVVMSLTIDSKATSITAALYFVQANQANLYEFNFYGGGTNISSGYASFDIIGSNIYSCRIFANTVQGDSTAIQMIHPGTNHVMLNGDAVSGTGHGYALSIRGAAFTDIYVRGNIISEGTNEYSVNIMVKHVFGILNIAWGGILDASGLGHGTAHALEVVNNNVGSKVYIRGNIKDTRTTTSVAAIRLIQNYTHFDYVGNIERAAGPCVLTTSSYMGKADIFLKGRWVAGSGSLLSVAGTQPRDVHIDMDDSTCGGSAVYVGGTAAIFLQGSIANIGQSSPLFHFPSIIPAAAKVIVGNLEFTGFDVATPLATTGTFTNQLNVWVKGAFRTNSTEPIPPHLVISWLTDITVPQGADLSAYVKKDGSTPFTGIQKGIPGVDPDDLATVSQLNQGGSGIQSVTGDSVDNTDPDNPVVNAIPLSGTEAGSPVTGDIEFDPYSGSKLLSTSVDGTPRLDLSRNDEGTYLEYVAQGGLYSYLQIAQLVITVYSDNPIFKGLRGNYYYGANYDDNTYVQKKYVDDLIANLPDGSAYEKLANKGVANGYAPLDGNQKVPLTNLPAIAITDTFVVSTQVAMLALTAQTGDICIRTDLNKTFVLKGSDPSVFGDWEELLFPTGTPTSVNGMIGVVTINLSWNSATGTLGISGGNTVNLGFTAADLINFAAAYGWGNHASAGYLTAMGDFTDLQDTPNKPTTGDLWAFVYDKTTNAYVWKELEESIIYLAETDIDTLAKLNAIVTDATLIGDAISDGTVYGRKDGSWVAIPPSSGGQVDTIVAGTGIFVDASDPINVIVRLNSGSLNSLGLANTALQSESDPVFVASPAYGITALNIQGWNLAVGWGNHAIAGYMKPVDINTLAKLNAIVADATLISDAPSNGNNYVRKDAAWVTIPNPNDGVDGVPGANALIWKGYNYGTGKVEITTSDSSTDFDKINRATIHRILPNTADATEWLNATTVGTAGGQMKITALDNHDVFAVFEFANPTSPVVPGTTDNLQVAVGTILAAAGDFSTYTDFVISYVLYGEKGIDGTNGTDGTDFQITEGTTFPTGPTAWQKYYRTDLGIMFEADVNRGYWTSVDAERSVWQKSGATGNTGQLNHAALNSEVFQDDRLITEVRFVNDLATIQGDILLKRGSTTIKSYTLNGTQAVGILRAQTIPFAANGVMKVQYDLTLGNGANLQVVTISKRANAIVP